jgi:uncharacterized membrane protein YgcG
MSVETDNKDFITTALSAVGPSLTPDFSKYTYGLWVSFFENPNHSENGYTVPKPLVEDIVASKFAVTGKRFSIINYEGEAPKARFFLTEGFLGLDGYDYLRDFEITDRFISGSNPNVIMPDMDYAGKVYRRYEITGLTKSKSTNNDILTVSGEDWAQTSIPVSANNTDNIYTYTDSGYSGYRNEVTTRYKFLYNDSGNSLVQDSSIFEIPFQLENQSSLKYRISRASEPLGIYDFAELTADGKAIIDYSKYKEEVSGTIDGQIVYNFEPISQLSFGSGEFNDILEKNITNRKKIYDPSLTGFSISKSNNLFKFALQSTGNFDDIYKVDVSVERFNLKDKPNISGYVMSSYDIGDGPVTISLSSGLNVFPRVNEDGSPFGYDNLQDLIDVEQIAESEKYAQDIQIPDAGDEEDESQLSKAIEDNFSATIKAINGEFEEDPQDNRDGEAWEVRSQIDSNDEEYLTQQNNEIQYYKTALPNFPLPKKIITKDFYSNYINSGESYIVTPLASYGLDPTFTACGDQFGVLGYYINESEVPGQESVFRTVVNSTCDGLYIDATGFCKGDSAIYDNKRYKTDGLKIQNGLVTQITESGVISKDAFINQESWLKAINYFYTKNYVASFNVYPSLPEASYNTLFSQALREVNERIGGPVGSNDSSSFYSNGARNPRIFVEREIYTNSYRRDESFEINQAITSGVYTPSDADLANEEVEKLYCVHTYEPSDESSFVKDKQAYFYPVQDYKEDVTFRKFLETSAAGLSYTTGENFGTVSFIDGDGDPDKLFRLEYVTGNAFSYNGVSSSIAWSGPATPASNISIIDQNTKNYSYHLYGYNNNSDILSFLDSNVISGDSVSSNSFSNLAVVKFVKQGLTDSVFRIEKDEDNTKVTLSSLNLSVADAAGNLLAPSKVRVNIQTYNYKVQSNVENHQWTVFNQNPINNNIYGDRKTNNLSEPRFFQDDAEDTKDVLSTLFFFPNGPYTSKNYEGKPISTSSIRSLSDGLYENTISIKEENENPKNYESNYVLEIADNGQLVKQKPSSSVLNSMARFSDTRRLRITKIKYNFYTKDLVVIGDAGSPYSINFNDGWEYDLQYKLKAGTSGSSGSSGTSGTSGSSGGGASVDWTIMSKEGPLTKDTISSQYSIISPYYFSAEDLESPNFLSMVAFKTNLPMFLDDQNYEFRILKRERLVVSSDSANVIKKTNFLPIKVDWDEVAGCGYYNIYQKDRYNNLTFLRSEPSGVNSVSYVVPDISQKNVNLGVYNFGANGNNYYDIIVSGVKSAIVKVEETLSGEYGFEVGNSDSDQNKISKLSQVTTYTPVLASGTAYSQLLDFNNPESKTSEFKIDQNYNNYYFVTDKADAILSNIPSSFEAYVINTGNASCNVDSTSISTNQYAKISNNGAVSSASASALPSSSLDLVDLEDGDSLYLTSNVTILNATVISTKTLNVINDSSSSITVTFGSTETIAANQTKSLTFNDDGSSKTIVLNKTYSNIAAQDAEIYHPKDGFVNFNHTTGSFSSADVYSNLPVYNFSQETLKINNLVVAPDSFNYVSWNGSVASKAQKSYFDDLKIYLKGTETTADSIKLLKDDSEIILSQFATASGITREYFFLKDESINRALNIKITNGSAVEVLSKQRQDFKLTVNRNNDSSISYSIIYPSGNPFFEISNSTEQLVLLKGNLIQNIDLKSLDSGLKQGSFVYFVNKNSSNVYFYRDKQENIIYTLAENQIARAMLSTVGSTRIVRLEILNDAFSHFYFDASQYIDSPINILDLNFCATQISLPSASQLHNKDLFLVCRNRFIPNKINKEKIKDVNSIVSTEDNPSTLEINEIGDLASNSISLRVFEKTSGDALPTVERTSFSQRTFLDPEDQVLSEDTSRFFYIRNEDVDTFTIKDFYNRKNDYNGKIFLPVSDKSLVVQSFDSADGNNLFRARKSSSIDFDYSPDGYVNGRLQVSAPDVLDSKIYSYQSEAGSTAKAFPNALATDQILMNFAYDTVTVSVDSSTVTLKKNRLVKNSGANYVYPIYNKKEFFIALVNSERTNTVVNGGTTFYYVIKSNVIDVDSIVLPDISATISFAIKNESGRPYQVKTLSGTYVYLLAPNDKKLFTYTGSPYTVTNDTTDFDDRSVINEPTSIQSSNQYLELDSEHPLSSLWSSSFAIDTIENAFIGETGDETSILLTSSGLVTNYRIFDVYSAVPSSNLAVIYCYGRKPVNLTSVEKYTVNDFYLFVKHNEIIIRKEQFYLSEVTKTLEQSVYNLNIIDTQYFDLTKLFDSQNTISNLPDIIFVPITKYSSKFYLPNLSVDIDGSTLGSLISTKRILFVNLIKSDASGANSIYNYSDSTTTNLLDINSLALFKIQSGQWVKETSSLPQVKKVFPTIKNIKGISGLSTTEVSSGKEFVYLPNFNRFNVDQNRFEDRSFRDFYVFNSCKYRMYVGSNNSMLGTGAFTKVSRDFTQNLFLGVDLDLNASSIFSVVNFNYAEGRAPENLTNVVNSSFPNLKFGTKIKAIQTVGNSSETHFFEYNANGIANEIEIQNKNYGILDVKDLLDYSPNNKLFVFGSSQINDTGNYFDSYYLKLLRATQLGSEKFYVYNNTPFFLSVYFDSEVELSLLVPPRILAEVSNSGLRFLDAYEKGKLTISKKQTNVNYILKSDLKLSINGLLDYTNFRDGQEDADQVKNILITNMVKDEQYVDCSYFTSDKIFIDSAFDNFKTVSMPSLGSMAISSSTVIKNIIKPVYSINSAGHYLFNDNNNDISVSIPASGEVFLINNCPRDIFVNILSPERSRGKLYRNSVLVLKVVDTNKVSLRYLKKSKARDEFYCVFNPNTAISTQREITLKLGIIRNEDLLPILDDDQVEQKSYVKLLAKDGSSSKINLALRNYYNGKDIPTDSPNNVVGYEVGIGHETIYRFLFFDASTSTYTLPGIQKGIKYQVSIDKSFFDNINISTNNSFTNTKEIPFLKYDGNIYGDGDTFEGNGVEVYEIKYPNFVRLYKVVEDINRPFTEAETKGEENGIDPSITEEEQVLTSELELFKEAILGQYREAAKSIITWIPEKYSAFWLESNYSDDWWVLDKIDATQTLTIALPNTSKTITFTKCQIKKTGLKTTLFKYDYSYYSALQTVRQMPNNKDLTIGLDADLNPTQIQRIKILLGQEQDAQDTLLPKSQMEIGGLYIASLFPDSELVRNSEITSPAIINSDFNVTVSVSKLKNMPDISFQDFSESSIIKIINKK